MLNSLTIFASQDDTAAFVGMMIFLCGTGPIAWWMLHGFFDYCCYGSRKALKTGKVAAFGASTAMSTTQSSTSVTEKE